MLNWDLQWSIFGNSMVYRYLDLFGMVFTDPNGLVSGMVLSLWQLVSLPQSSIIIHMYPYVMAKHSRQPQNRRKIMVRSKL
jgi:hypothetical protein